MKHRFIIRNPFVSEQRKRSGKLYLDVATVQLGASAYTANRLQNTDEAIYYLTRGMEHLNSAARNYGFRNASDFQKWIVVHGRLP